MARLDGKVGIMSGGAMGLGEAHPRPFARAGAKVVLTDIAVEVGCAVASDPGKSTLSLEHEVRDQDAWARVVAESTRAFGPVTIVHSGISGPKAKTADLSESCHTAP